RVDDIRRALRDARLGVEDAERSRELALDVGKHRERQVPELVLCTAPGVMHEFAVDAHTEELRIARLELLLELAERGNLGRAHEREVLRPEEEHAPLARLAVLREGLERLVEIVRDDAGQRVVGKFLSNTQHVFSLRKAWLCFQ